VRDDIKKQMQAIMSKRIRQFRLEHNLTQEQMAEKLRISPRSYGDLERGTMGCSLQTYLQFLMCLPEEERRLLEKEYEQLTKEEVHGNEDDEGHGSHRRDLQPLI